MPTLRRADARGHSHAGVVETRHAFSSGDFHDPRWMGWGALRVANDETLAPGAVIDAQRHANMDVLTLVVSGLVRYRNALAEGELRSGDVHLLAAGSGIAQRIDNASGDHPAQLLRFWIQPARVNTPPRSAVWRAMAEVDGVPARIASPDGDGGSLLLGQSAWLHRLRLAPASTSERVLSADRVHWLQVVRGVARIDGEALRAGDALGYGAEACTVRIATDDDAGVELLWFALPA